MKKYILFLIASPLILLVSLIPEIYAYDVDLLFNWSKESAKRVSEQEEPDWFYGLDDVEEAQPIWGNLGVYDFFADKNEGLIGTFMTISAPELGNSTVKYGNLLAAYLYAKDENIIAVPVGDESRFVTAQSSKVDDPLIETKTDSPTGYLYNWFISHVKNATSPLPPRVLLLVGSGLIGFVAIRRRISR